MRYGKHVSHFQVSGSKRRDLDSSPALGMTAIFRPPSRRTAEPPSRRAAERRAAETMEFPVRPSNAGGTIGPFESDDLAFSEAATAIARCGTGWR